MELVYLEYLRRMTEVAKLRGATGAAATRRERANTERRISMMVCYNDKKRLELRSDEPPALIW